ncbi:phosphotransferase family protein [Microlunatus speluncae]|uniref:phosphotransferase family protein n=1 Tax=Microlunatus speluncae TaxID=2594267 RepID=UPI0012660F65|nr:aminoglycoside phosphotransferase family protein [Microlunatus speluncae]
MVLKTGPTDLDATRRTTHPVSIRASMATEVAALAVAENNRLPVPHLIAVDLDGLCGRIALLTTAVQGSPTSADDVGVRNLGELLPRIHAITVPSDPNLPGRVRAREGDNYVAFRARQREDIDRYRTGTRSEQQDLRDRVHDDHPEWAPQRVRRYLTVPATTPLIMRAEQVLSRLPCSTEPAGFVHDDIAPGNVIWTTSRGPVLIDWEGAGSGPAGLDLGNVRFELALRHGAHTADLVLEGWRRNGSVAVPDDLPYWDLSAALNTPVNLASWSSDPIATERRDHYLAHVLNRLGHADQYDLSSRSP